MSRLYNTGSSFLARLSALNGGLRRRLLKRENGLGTLEIVVITGILLSVALLFNQEIQSFAQRLFRSVFHNNSIVAKF